MHFLHCALIVSCIVLAAFGFRKRQLRADAVASRSRHPDRYPLQTARDILGRRVVIEPGRKVFAGSGVSKGDRDALVADPLSVDRLTVPAATL